MGTLNELLSFAVCWIGVMVLIGGALLLTQKFRRKEDETTINPKEYTKKFEEELNQPTPEKDIKKEFRNPFFLSPDEIKETKEKAKNK